MIPYEQVCRIMHLNFAFRSSSADCKQSARQFIMQIIFTLVIGVLTLHKAVSETQENEVNRPPYLARLALRNEGSSFYFCEGSVICKL